MSDASFIAAGWIGTAVAVTTYAVSVERRTRRARRATPELGVESCAGRNFLRRVRVVGPAPEVDAQ